VTVDVLEYSLRSVYTALQGTFHTQPQTEVDNANGVLLSRPYWINHVYRPDICIAEHFGFTALLR